MQYCALCGSMKKRENQRRGYSTKLQCQFSLLLYVLEAGFYRKHVGTLRKMTIIWIEYWDWRKWDAFIVFATKPTANNNKEEGDDIEASLFSLPTPPIQPSEPTATHPSRQTARPGTDSNEQLSFLDQINQPVYVTDSDDEIKPQRKFRRYQRIRINSSR